MLTPEDLKNIGELMDIKLTFLEDRMNVRFDALEKRMDSLEEKMDILSESVDEVRSTVNVLAAWADKTSKFVKIAL